ncbi:MAG: menaquinol-cytochrome c reductase cytochrome b subunit, partial [Acidimicrobiales bacterium]|nr:menaquinol-cytochrome c reductase cytochrome b subunit [Acidimicrobiales bacterium]
MTEIPEHLRKRAEEARQKAAGAAGADKPAEAGSTEATAPGGESTEGRIPVHLLDRSKAAANQPAPGADPAPGGGGAPTPGSGPDGHNQRLLTVVKSGSIQDTKSVPQDKVHVWPHLLVAEFLAALAVTLFTLLFSIFVNAPLLDLANFNQTPNPSKAPWYFLGLQEMLTMFHPMVAGVTIPGIGLILLVMAPYIDKNPSKAPEDRK